MIRTEFVNLTLDNILHNWDACLRCCPFKEKEKEFWLSHGMLKFNIDGAPRGKLGLTGIGGVFRDSNRQVLIMFSKHIGVENSNEAEVLAYLEAFKDSLSLSHALLTVESDSSNVKSSISCPVEGPWKFQFHLNGIKILDSSPFKIKKLASSFQVVFRHVRWWK